MPQQRHRRRLGSAALNAVDATHWLSHAAGVSRCANALDWNCLAHELIGVNAENNTCSTAPRRKSSSGGGAFAGRIFAAERAWGKLLLGADVGNKEARIYIDARLFE
jgi:hypothetical protein